MSGRILEDKFDFEVSSKSAFSSKDATFTSRSFYALLGRNSAPESHKRIADNYLVVKKFFKFQACLSRITKVETALLARYDFKPLEETSSEEMFYQLALLQKWSVKGDDELKSDSLKILEIRVKELKYLEANCYTTVSGEICDGYQALNQYLREISKFSLIKSR